MLFTHNGKDGKNRRMTNVRTTDDIRANPMVGDILVTREYPPGTPFQETTEFEVWDGVRWVSSGESEIKMYVSTSL